jgi:prepilin-type N-terminal cleavage/methylation domain-containing protein/prepilin-type processing-associated H-X9-DG protein
MNSANKKAFTLVELLVVISIIAVLLTVLMPALSAAKSRSKAVVCRSNLHQLVLANIGYATENEDSFVAAGFDMFPGGDNNHRWHGVRDDNTQPFDSSRGPLVAYLGDGSVTKCPQKVKFVKGNPSSWDFEDGCGGYGYNMTYLGSRIWSLGFTSNGFAGTTKDYQVKQPSKTLMFADTALARLNAGVPYYIEYSFTEPRYFVNNGPPQPAWGDPSPSIHFRHLGSANTGWTDGHVDNRKMALYQSQNTIYGNIDFLEMELGWFEPLDNTMFDLK